MAADRDLADATHNDLERAHRAGIAAGMFFTFAARDPDVTWRRAETLYTEPAQLDRLLAAFAQRLGPVPPRVVASLLYQGFAARLLSPPLAGVIGAGCLIDVGDVEWTIPSGQSLALTASPDSGRTGDVALLLYDLVDSVYPTHLLPLAAALRRRVRVAAGLLRGNAAASLVSGLRLLAGRDWQARAVPLLRHPQLRNTITITPQRYTRRSCCLYYRVSPASLCGDCPLPKPP